MFTKNSHFSKECIEDMFFRGRIQSAQDIIHDDGVKLGIHRSCQRLKTSQ